MFTTKSGRISESTLRRDLYRITQPCRYGQTCPYDTDPDECGARNHNDRLSHCPSSVSPHPVRRGGICHQIKKGVDKDKICERANVSRKVLEEHYDIRTREEARKQRREELKKHLDGYEEPTALQPTAFQSQIPLLRDAVHLKQRAQQRWDDPAARRRVVSGLAGYVMFVVLVAINFAFLGIGVDLVNQELFFGPW